MNSTARHLPTKELSLIQTNDDDTIIFLNELLNQAILLAASDIHIEQTEDNCVIRFRIDGSLQNQQTVQPSIAERMMSRLKVLAKIDIAEKRYPQDGRFTQVLRGQKIDIRLSSCPTFFGEKLVLRMLTRSFFTIDSLGMDQTQRQIFTTALNRSQGLILLTGPTGCGKTTSLYAGIDYLNHSERNIMTVEDPVEMILTGVNQIQVNEKINLTFSTLLRFLLRQDPDVLMVGEIRDKETAEIVLQAAETGHIVLSSMHANNSFAAFNRLTSFGLTHETVLGAITLIIAQRLLRQLCSHCKTLNTSTNYYDAKDCIHCHQGYLGRIAIYEFLPLTQRVKEQLQQHNFVLPLANLNLRSLQDHGMDLVREGVTSLAEFQRVLM